MVRVSLSILSAAVLAHLGACCLPPANSAYKESKIRDYRPGKSANEKRSTSLPEKKYNNAINHKTKKSNSKQLAALDKSKLSDLSEDENSAKEIEEQKEVSSKETNKKPPLTLLRQINDLPHPQSILFDEKRLRFYVSRLGKQAEKSKGSIAMLARDGSIINREWIKGLDQPRGLAMVDNYLYVADGKSLLKVDVETAKIEKRYEQPDAFYLYDVSATKSGELFVTDPLSNTILTLKKDEELKVWLHDKKLEGPNSIIVKDDQLFVSSIGLNSASTKQETGKIIKINRSSKAITPFSKQKEMKKVASLALDEEGSLYATTVGAPHLMRLSLKEGKLQEDINVQSIFNLKDEQGLADFYYFPQSKEFWVPVKNNGHILVFVRSDAALLTEGNERN